MPIRLYEGVNLNTINDRAVRSALKSLDDFCRSLYDAQAVLRLSGSLPASVGPGIAAAVGASDTFARADHVHAFIPNYAFARKTSDQAVTAVGYVNDVDVTGLGFSVEAGFDYSFVYEILVTTDAITTGPRFSVNGPAGTGLGYGVTFPFDNGVAPQAITYAALQTGYDAGGLTTSGPGTTGGCARLVGTLFGVTAAGTLILRANTETGTTTVKAGSFGVLYRHG